MITLADSHKTYAKRRDHVFADLKANQDLLIYFNAPVRRRNHDCFYTYRPDSSFYYLSGLAEEESAFLFWKEKQNGKVVQKTHFFVMEKDATKEMWEGKRLGPKKAKKILGVTDAFPVSELDSKIVKWLEEVPAAGLAPRIFSNVRHYTRHRLFLSNLLEKFEPFQRTKGAQPIGSLIDFSQDVEQARLIKNPEEIDLMKKSSAINVEAHLELMHGLKPGMYEYQMQAIVESAFTMRGAPSKAYNSICAGGENACILHYTSNDKKLKAGELFLVDAGCEYKYYASDITRTLPISGKYNSSQKNIMDLVLEAQQEAIAKVKKGNSFSEIHEASTMALISGLRKLKLLKGSAKQILSSQSYKKYFPHGTSHWLGIDVHDPAPVVDKQGKSVKLAPGMVLTVEPGLYFPPGDKSIPKEYRGIGVRIEDDVLVTAKGNEVLTGALPKSAKDIEKEMRRAV